MKKYLALPILCIALPVFAQPAPPQKGFSGEVSLNAGIISSTSNFNVDGSASTLFNKSVLMMSSACLQLTSTRNSWAGRTGRLFLLPALATPNPT
ncbi:MAG: DUF2860 domain-containing protein [Marinobacter sp.]|uniref:DUF2860 domain-containing protein n=1 Tax=uncultured Marinobacter sp. TaxID=187379 RepID=UPI001F53ED7E|nr:MULTISPECIES: DUF2860 domain-containing protein [Marinobacter]MCW8867115.1 DUF2860 domain-containing protein [Marinobacter sp.]MCW8977387.1 DUF2860 domain-containing protein [Marinobacter sp.]